MMDPPEPNKKADQLAAKPSAVLPAKPIARCETTTPLGLFGVHHGSAARKFLLPDPIQERRLAELGVTGGPFVATERQNGFTGFFEYPTGSNIQHRSLATTTGATQIMHDEQERLPLALLSNNNAIRPQADCKDKPATCDRYNFSVSQMDSAPKSEK
jgi:hypothetical protein